MEHHGESVLGYNAFICYKLIGTTTLANSLVTENQKWKTFKAGVVSIIFHSWMTSS
jgi:hypothetical protein